MSSDTTTISQLPVAGSVSDDDLVPIVQGGTTKRATVGQLQTSVLLDQEFITVDSEPGLPQSRRLTATGGLQLTDNGAGSTFSLATIGLLNSLSALGSSGIIVNSGGTAVARIIIAPPAGIGIANGDGIAGNPTLSLTNDLAAVEALATTGFVKRTGIDTWGTVTSIVLTTDVTGTLPATNGGTGFASYAVGDLIYANTTTTFAKLADVATGNALISGGVGVAPSYGKIGLTTHISGVLAEANGGTNQSTYTTGDILYASAANTLSKLADAATGNALISGGVGVAPSYGKIGLTTHVSGVLPEVNGGTNQSTYTTGDILYASASNTLSKLPDVAAGSFLRSGGVATAPAWSTTTWPNSSAQGDINYSSAANTFVTLAKDTNATRYLSNTGTNNNPAWAQVALTTGVSGVLPVANGGTNLASGTSGGILGYTAAGTLASSALLTLNGIVIGGGAGATPTSTAGMTDGQLLVGQTSAAPLPKTISGAITLAASGAASINTTLPTRQTFTSGSGTYTTPANVRWIRIQLIGGGGGGNGSGTTPGNGGNGGNTTFSTLTGGGGTGATGVSVNNGGTASGGNLINAPGGAGAGRPNNSAAQFGGNGGSGFFGGAGAGGDNSPTAGLAGATNTGGGGGGAGCGATAFAGGGGGAGGYVAHVITSPDATYSYAVGAAGTAGTAGTGGAAGGGGAAGYIVVEEFYV